MNEARRAYFREWARKKREREWQRQVVGLAAALRCPKRHGPGVCGGPLITTTDALGRTVVRCPWCERVWAGICRDCPRPVEGTIGKALRCAEHRLAHLRDIQRRSEERHHEERLVRAREYQRRPDLRARKLEYKRLYRLAHPEKIQAQKRRAALRQPKHVYNYMRRYRKRHRLHFRELGKRLYYEHHRERPTLKCMSCGDPIPWTPGEGRPAQRCDRCVFPCERRRREAVRRRRLGRAIRALRERLRLSRNAFAKRFHISFAALVQVEEGRKSNRRTRDRWTEILAAAAARAKPRPVRRPAGVAIRLEAGRKCLSDDCTAIVRGRQKKCAACLERARVTAVALLAMRSGRGRRTDLELQHTG